MFAIPPHYRNSCDAPPPLPARYQNVAILIEANELALLGIVRQEILSGIKQKADFDRIEATTHAVPLFFAMDEDHVTAARFYNVCRTKGIQGSPIDFLICAMSVRLQFPIYTTDPDFILYAAHLPIKLYRR